MRFLSSIFAIFSIPSIAAFSCISSSLSHPSSPLRASSSTEPFSRTTQEVTGIVKWYNPTRGFGFIACDDGGPDMYVHATGLDTDGPLVDGDHVRFVTQMDVRTKKPKAVNVAKTNDTKIERVSSSASIETISVTNKVDVSSKSEPVGKLSDQRDTSDLEQEIIMTNVGNNEHEGAAKDNFYQKNFMIKEVTQRQLLQAKFKYDAVTRENTAMKVRQKHGEMTQRQLLQAKFTYDAINRENTAMKVREKLGEMTQRQLLQAKFKYDAVTRENTAMKVRQKLGEMNQRQLLQAKFTYDAITRENTAMKVRQKLGEMNQRQLLQAKFTYDAITRENTAMKAREKRHAEDEASMKKRNQLKEMNQRALFSAKLHYDSAARANAAAEQARIAEEIEVAAIAAEAKKIQEEVQARNKISKRKKSILDERNQRALLRAKLSNDATARVNAAVALKMQILKDEEEAHHAVETEKAHLTKEEDEGYMAAETEEAHLTNQEFEARSLGYPSASVIKARRYPKSSSEEADLAAKYAAIKDIGERAFAILTDLGMVEINLDPDDPTRDRSLDDEEIIV